MHGILHLEPFDIAHSIDFSKGLSIPIDSIPRQHIDGKIRIGKKVRCEIRYGLLENKGGTGISTSNLFGLATPLALT